MYQAHKNSKHTEEDFNILIKDFEECIMKIDPPTLQKEWDLSKTYSPNWACLWNKPKNINKECEILHKNNRVAFVSFKDKSLNDKDIVGNIYRLEDLEII